MNMYVQTKTFTQMLITTSYIKAKKWEQHKCSLSGERIIRMYIHTMESYVAVKKGMKYWYNMSKP